MKKYLMILLALLPVFSCSRSTVYDVTRFGAKGDGVTDDAAAIQQAVDRAAENGGTVVFPAGKTFLSGPVRLRGGVEYRLEPKAVLKAHPDETRYHLSAFGRNEGEGMLWLWAEDEEDIVIDGAGTIDGNGVAFMGEELEDSYDLKPVTDFDPRPHVLTLKSVNHVIIRDITIREGAYWTVHLVGCTDVLVSGVSLLNNLKIRNGDGIDIDHSRKVRISDCYITSGDDCICLKNRREFAGYGPCEDVVVTNCVMTSRSCAVKIGSENMDRIGNVLFQNCIIRAGNRGIGIQNRDEGTVENVRFQNMYVESLLWSDVWWGKAEPIYVTSYPRASVNHKDANWRFPEGATEGACGEVSDIYFTDIQCDAANGVFVGGDVPGKVHGIRFDRVDIRLAEERSAVYDLRPRKGEGFIPATEVPYCFDVASNIWIDGKKVR